MFLNKIFGTLLLSVASCNPTTYIQEPNRAYMPETYEVINGTENTLYVGSGYYGEDYEISPNSTSFISFRTEDNVYVWTNQDPTGIGYCYLAPDSEELNTISWIRQAADYWEANIPSYSPATGIGFYRLKSLATDTNYYYKTIDFEIYNQANQMDSVKILPSGSVARLYKEDGTYTQVTSDDLVLFRKKVDGTTLMATALGINVSQQVGANVYMIVAMNFMYATINAFQPSELSNMASKSLSTMSGYMFYYSGYTNRLKFVSGNLPFYPNDKGYVDPKFITDIDSGFIGFNQNGDQTSSTFTALKAGTDLMEKAIAVAVTFFGFVIFPGVTIGTLLLIPLLSMLLIWLIRLLKRGG